MAGRTLAAGILAASIAAVAAASSLYAHGGDNEYAEHGYGMGPGMMGGYGMGPGMMGGYGMGPGMMGGYGTGPGMMGGYGMGPGMMGGYGMGPGMMGGGPGSELELNSDQREQIIDIQSGLRKQHWTLHGQMMDAQDQLSKLYAEETPDPKKIGTVYGKIFDLRRQMIEATIEARNRQHAVLTPEQRQQLQENAYQPNRGYYGPGPGTMPHGFGHHMMGG